MAADRLEVEAVARALHEISDDVLPFGQRRTVDRGARRNRHEDKRLDERRERYMEQARVAIAALDSARSTQPEEEVRELSLRLARVHEFLAKATVDEDTGELQEDAGGLLSALDYAVRGDPGCVDPGENESERCAALARHREYLGLADRLGAGCALSRPKRKANMNDRSTHSHDHGTRPSGRLTPVAPPPAVEVSFLGGDYAKDGRATVRLRIVSTCGTDEETLASVDLLADQARHLSGVLSDVAAEVAATEGRR